MSEQAVEGFRAEREAILDIARSLSDEEWNSRSDCAGWTTRDVLAHMAATLHGVVDPAYLPDMTAGTEGAMEGPVELRRRGPVADVLEEYETYSDQAADVFAAVQAPGVGETSLPMGDLGTHTMAMLPGTFLFDAYTHLRVDMLSPYGSVERPEPPRDVRRLGPTIEWMLAGLPWMCADALAKLVDRPLQLELTGTGGGTWSLAPGGDEGRIAITAGNTGDAAATVTSDAHDFVIWGTQRRPWRDFVAVKGNAEYAASVLDAVNVI